MLSNINISNLENSVTDSSVYSDACENSIQLEQLYEKKHEFEFDNKNIKNINDKNNDIIINNKSEDIKLLNKFGNIDDLKDIKINENFNLRNLDELKKKNINNRYIVNKNINYKNISNINLSNVNIIINNNNNDKENIGNISSKNIINNIPNLEINKNKNKNTSSKSIKSIKKDDKNNIEKNSIKEKKDKKENNLEEPLKNNINESLSKNINNSKSMTKKNISTSTMNIINEFENITIITKKKKKGNNNNITNSTIAIPNKSISFFSNDNSIMNDKVKFKDISYNQVDLNYLRHLRIIPVKLKKKGNRYLKTILELQHFYVDSSDIRVIKLSEDGKYLSAGLKNGKIKLFEIIGYDYPKFEISYDKTNIMKYLNFIKEKSYKSLEGHKEDVIDLSWSPFYTYLLLSSSVDGYVILWNVELSEQKSKIECFNHEKIVTCVSFSPTDKYIFITGCLDKIIRIWDIKDIINKNKENITDKYDIYEKYNKEYFNIEEKITSLNYYPNGKEIAIGTHNGKIIIYELKGDKYYYKGSISCRNRLGKNSFGKKITSIEFINKNYAVVSSCDSRIRLLYMNDDSKIIYKYKGYLNENSMIKSSIDHNYDIIISGSEDGFVYVWDIYNSDNERKNSNYEYFKPYSHEKIQCSLIVPEKIYCNYMKKILKITNKLMIYSIIINATDKGRLEILLNIDEEN